MDSKSPAPPGRAPWNFIWAYPTEEFDSALELISKQLLTDVH